MAKLLQNLPYFAKLTIKQPIPKLFSPTQIQNISFFRKSQPKENPFLIVRANNDDTCEILDLFWDNYFPEEPTVSSLGLGRTRNPVFDDEIFKYLSQGFSLVAKCKYNGCIVGASINIVACPWDPDNTEKFACTLKCPKMAQLFMFYAHLQRVPDLWEKYCQNQVFEIQNVVVKIGDRRKGLARRLMECSRDLAADAGFRVVRVDATNIYSALVCEKMKMKLVHEIPYCSYIGEDHEPIFKPPSPQNSVKVYVSTPHAYVKK